MNARLTVLAPLRRAIARVPAGERLNIRALREPLGLSQSECLAAIELLIEEGRLDRLTLRAPVVERRVPFGDRRYREYRDTQGTSGANGEGVPPHREAVTPVVPSAGERRTPDTAAPDLASLARFFRPQWKPLREPAKRWGQGSTFQFLSKARALRDLGLVEFRQGAPYCFWRLAPGPASSGPDCSAAPKRPSRPERTGVASGVSGVQLADELTAYIKRHGLSARAVGKHLFNSRSAIDRLRLVRPKLATIQKVRAFVAAPPSDELKLRAAPRAKGRRRDLSRGAKTPLMDLEKRRRRNGHRRAAAVNRAIEQRATKLLDTGADPSTQRSVIAARMREIQRRRDDEARQFDPVEQAKLTLRRRGNIVFEASVIGGPKGRYTVSGHRHDNGKARLFSGKELIALAARVAA